MANAASGTRNAIAEKASTRNSEVAVSTPRERLMGAASANASRRAAGRSPPGCGYSRARPGPKETKRRTGIQRRGEPPGSRVAASATHPEAATATLSCVRFMVTVVFTGMFMW
ncbi:hypothetical protein ACWGI8_06770 [Streptomyces sp. NPDC054841]